MLLTSSAQTQETHIAVEHGIFVSLLLDAGLAEVGAYDWVQVGDWFDYADRAVYDHGQSLAGQRVGDEGTRNPGTDNDDVALRWREGGVAHLPKAIRQQPEGCAGMKSQKTWP